MIKKNEMKTRRITAEQFTLVCKLYNLFKVRTRSRWMALNLSPPLPELLFNLGT